MENISLSAKAKSIKLGIYQHFKGKECRVFGVALHSESQEEMVIYQALYGKELVWIRPIDSFLSEAAPGVPRFKFIKS